MGNLGNIIWLKFWKLLETWMPIKNSFCQLLKYLWCLVCCSQLRTWNGNHTYDADVKSCSSTVDPCDTKTVDKCDCKPICPSTSQFVLLELREYKNRCWTVPAPPLGVNRKHKFCHPRETGKPQDDPSPRKIRSPACSAIPGWLLSIKPLRVAIGMII